MDYYFPPLNVAKSIRKYRLIYQLTFTAFFCYLMYCFMAIAWLAAFYTVGAALLKAADVPSYVIVWYAVALLVWGLLDTCVMHLPVKINGTVSNRDTRKMLDEALNARFTSLSRMKNTKDYVRYVKGPKFIGLKISISCLFDGSDVYINMISLGRADALIPFFGIINYYRCKRLAKSLSKENKEKYECGN